MFGNICAIPIFWQISKVSTTVFYNGSDAINSIFIIKCFYEISR